MLVIVDYGVGNLTSILNMFRRIGVNASISNEVKTIAAAAKILLPGVGHFDTCMKNFNNSNLRPLIERKMLVEKVPTLGICVGAQMLTRASEEGNEKGLGIVPADTVRFSFATTDSHKIPHMGWADLKVVADSPLWKELPPEPRFYFAHSYHFRFDDEAMVTGIATYGYPFPCAFRKDNIFATQFHPEKSHRFGMKVLENFASI